MSTIDEKRAAFHQYLSTSGVISALSKALIKLYEEPTKPDDPVNFVRRHMGSEDFFILGDGKVQNAEEELVLSSLIEKKSEETVIGNEELNDGQQESNQVVNEGDGKPIDDAETANVVEETEVPDGEKIDDTEVANVDVPAEIPNQEIDQLNSEFEKLKSNEECNSILKTHLTDELFEKLKSVDGGVALYDCIKSGLENQDSVVGIYATNLQFYDQLSDIFDSVIETYHSFGKESVQPSSEWGDTQAFEPFNGSDEFVVSIRMNCARNMQEYPVVCKMEENDLNDSLAKIKAITEGFEEASKGTFYVMADITEEQVADLKNVGASMENSDKYLSSANAYQQLPTGRGVFVAEDKSMIIHINEADHLKFISTESSKDFGKIYRRLVDTISLFELQFAWHDRLGWLTFSPANLGTALNISIELKLPKLQANPDKLQEIINNSPIQIKLRENEAESTHTFYNQSTMGHSEFDLAKQFYDVIQAIMECESSIE